MVIYVTSPKDPMFTAKVLIDRRRELGISQREIARRSGLSTALINGFFRGDYDPRNSSVANLRDLARALDWTLEDIQFALELKQAQVREITGQRTRLIPKYRTVSAGPGLDDGELIGYVEIPEGQSGDVAYEVDGHSMEPDIRSGDTVIVKRGVFSLGDVVVAFVPDSGMVIKRLMVDSEEKRAILKSKNPDYGQLIAEGADIKGKVVEIRRRL